MRVGLGFISLLGLGLGLLLHGSDAQPGRDCLALCPGGANNVSCSLSCAQCDYNCCNSSCSSLPGNKVCNPSCFAVTLNVYSCCVNFSTIYPVPPPPPPVVPRPGNCSVVSIQSGNLTVTEGVPFTFNFSAVTCSAAVCPGVCSAFTGAATFFQVIIADNLTGWIPPVTSCNVTAGSPPGFFPITCLAQSSFANATYKYLLTASILSYGVWVPVMTRYLRIIAGPIYIPACVASWGNGNGSIIAGTNASLYIIQKDAYNNTVCTKTGSQQVQTLPLTLIYNVPVNTTAYRETFNVSTDVDQGVQTISFSPKLAGTFYLQIGNQSQVVQKSPIRYDVLPGPLSISDSITQWPSGINTFEAGTNSSVLILLMDRFGNNILVANYTTLNVTFIDTGVKAPFLFNVSLLPSGAWSAYFVPTVAGQYHVRVANNDSEVPMSPLAFSVVSGPVSVKDCLGSWLGGNNTIVAGAQATFLVLQMDAYSNNVSLTTGSIDAYDFNASVVNLANNQAVPKSLTVLQPPDIGSGYRTIVHTPNGTGNFSLSVGGSGYNISGSPFPFTVIPGPLSVPNCYAVWANGSNFTAGSNVSVIIYKRDKYNVTNYDDFNFTATFISRTSRLPAGTLVSYKTSMEKLPASNYVTLSFVPTISGRFSCVIGTLMESIQSWPMDFNVTASSISVPLCTGSWFRRLDTFTAGTRGVLDIYMRDVYNNTVTTGYTTSYFNASVLTSPNDTTQILWGFNLSIVNSNTTQGRQNLNLDPTSAGTFWLRVWRLNETLLNSTIPFTVTAAPISPLNSTVLWPNNTNVFRAGEPATMMVLFRDKYMNIVSAANGRTDDLGLDFSVIGVPDIRLWNMTEAPYDFSGYQPVVFYPLVTGTLGMQVRGNDLNLSGSPFTFIVKGGFLSIPASSGQLSGSYITQNGTVTFLIYPRDRFGNPVLTSDIDPKNFSAQLYNSDLTIIPILDLNVSVYDGYTLLMKFSVSTVGKFILQVGNDTDDISGTPFLLYGATDTVDPSRCIMEGDGLKNSSAGNLATIIFQLRDTSGNPAVASLLDVDVKMYMRGVAMNVGMNITAVPRTTGIFQATYTPVVVGDYQVAITWKGTLIGAGLAVNKTVFPNGVYPPYCIAVGNTATGIAGQLLNINVTIVDFYNNTDPYNRTVIAVSWWPVFVQINTTVISWGFGKFSIYFNCTSSGGRHLTIKAGTLVANQQIAGSPFRVDIRAAAIVLPYCFCSFKNNINYTFSGRKVALDFFMRDIYMNAISSVDQLANLNAIGFNATVYNGSTIAGPPLNTSDMAFDLTVVNPFDAFELKFTVVPMGTYIADPVAGSLHLKGGPFVFQIAQEPPNSTFSIFTGSGLQDTTVGQLSVFNATLLDVFGKPVIGNFQGQNTSYLVVTVSLVSTSATQQAQILEEPLHPGQYRVTYSPSVPGSYQILINWQAPLFTTFLGLYNISVV